jgi:hypothetical protein
VCRLKLRHELVRRDMLDGRHGDDDTWCNPSQQQTSNLNQSCHAAVFSGLLAQTCQASASGTRCVLGRHCLLVASRCH